MTDVGAPQDDAKLERPGGLLSRIDGHIVIYHEPASLQAEQYRALRANLAAMNPKGAPWTIALTSARKGEGKTVTAVNLAACLAELPGSRVCIVDADCRSPGVAALLGVQPRGGMTDVLSGRSNARDVIRPTILPGLDCIHAGPEPENPAELLDRPAFTAFLEELKRRYSWIVLDTPPVNPFTDGCVVASRCDGCLVVVRLLAAPKDLVASTLDAIRTAGGRLLGTFLTGLQPDRDDGEEVAGYERISAGDRRTLGRRGKEDRQRRQAERQRLKQERALLRQRKRDVAGGDSSPPV